MGGKFENYKILAEIGRGGMGMVYKALDERSNTIVAIKQLILENIDQKKHKEFRERFRREAQTVSRLDHKNIVKVFEISQNQESHYYVMEFLEGHSLRKEINRQGGRCSLGSYFQIIEQVAEGLSYAHSMNVVHRDVKPDNIFILKDGLVKITDFGIARVADLESIDLTKTGVMLGTLAYVSPEQLQNAKTVDHRADIFSLGVVSYEALCGDIPFTGDGIAATIVKIMSSEEVPLHIANPQITPEISGVISRALRKKPRDRYRSVNEFMRDFKHNLASAGFLGLIQDNLDVNPLVTSLDMPGQSQPATSSLEATSADLKNAITTQGSNLIVSEMVESFKTSSRSEETKSNRSEFQSALLNNVPDEKALKTGEGEGEDFEDEISEDSIEPLAMPPDTTLTSKAVADFAVRVSLDKEGLLDERTRARFSTSGKHRPLSSSMSGPVRIPSSESAPEKKESGQRTSELPGEAKFPDRPAALDGLLGRLAEAEAPYVQPTYNPIKLLFSIKQQGVKEKPFQEPSAISYRSGRILVADSASRTVHMFSRDGRWLCDLTHRPDAADTKTGGGRFTKPSGIAIDERSRIYVCDSSDHFIRVFDGQGVFIKEFRNIQGVEGGLSGITIDTTGLLYLSDSMGGCLQVFQSDIGIWVRSIGSKGEEPGQLQLPAGLATDRLNRVYVADYGTSRISIFNKAGGLVRTFGRKGNQKGMFNVPRGVAVDKHERIFVLDSLNHRIQVFGQSGDWLYTFGGCGQGDEELLGPSGISIDNENGILFVADKGNRRIQVFQLGFK